MYAIIRVTVHYSLDTRHLTNRLMSIEDVRKIHHDEAIRFKDKITTALSKVVRRATTEDYSVESSEMFSKVHEHDAYGCEERYREEHKDYIQTVSFKVAQSRCIPGMYYKIACRLSQCEIHPNNTRHILIDVDTITYTLVPDCVYSGTHYESLCIERDYEDKKYVEC